MVATWDDRLKVLGRTESMCQCGTMMRIYKVEKKDGTIVDTNIHRCAVNEPIGLNGRVIEKKRVGL